MAERGYTIDRTFDASPDEVWDAWTDPAQFAVWFGTEALQMHGVELDVKPNGRWKGTMVLPDGTEKHWHGVYREVERRHRLVMDLTDAEGDEFERYTVTFEEHGTQTRITLRQSGGHLSDAEYERARQGTDAFMDSMQGMLKARHDAN